MHKNSIDITGQTFGTLQEYIDHCKKVAAFNADH